MPVHFDAAFHPNGWMNKPWAPLMLPLSGIFTVFVATIFFHFDPKMRKCDEDTRQHVKKVLSKVLIAVAVFLSTCSITLIWAAWGNLKPVTATIFYGLPLMLLVLGNCLGKLRPNYTIGIRVRWTLESPTVWAKTHRLGGRLLVAISVALLVLAITNWNKDAFAWIAIGCLLAWSLVVIIYSFVISRQEYGQSQTA